MTEKIGTTVVIEKEKPQQCDLCGKVAELRPYGPKGEMVCFPCGMKDEKAAKRAFARLIQGTRVVLREER